MTENYQVDLKVEENALDEVEHDVKLVPTLILKLHIWGESAL